MRRLFGSGKKAPGGVAGPGGGSQATIQHTNDKIVQMRGTLDVLEKKEKHLDMKIEKEVKMARSLAVSNKPAALLALKRKKEYEAQREHVRGARFNIETQIMTIENATINLETLNAMRTGSDAMRVIHGELDIDKVDTIMDDVREQFDLAKEVSTAISSPLGIEQYDEDDLMAELDEIAGLEEERELLNVDNVPTLKQQPVKAAAVSSKAPPVAVTHEKEEILLQDNDDDEKELEELRASML